MLFRISLNCPIRLVKAYFVERKTVWSTIEPENLLIIVLDGKGNFKVGENEYILTQNQGIFIPAGQEYERSVVDDKAATYVYFHFISECTFEEITSEQAYQYILDDSAKCELAMLADISYHSMPIENMIVNQTVDFQEKFIPVWTKISEQLLSRHIESRFLMHVYFNEILGYAFQYSAKLVSENTCIANVNSIHHSVKKAVLYMNQNYNKAFKLKEVCDFCGISPQHLIRLFHEHLNITPTKYMNRIKINHAKNLIQNRGNLSMKEIAFELGFENPHYFSRLFTQTEGQSPSEYKARVSVPNDQFHAGVAMITVQSKRTKKRKP